MELVLVDFEDFEVVKDSESFELKTINMSKTNRDIIDGLKEKLSRFKVGKNLSGFYFR